MATPVDVLVCLSEPTFPGCIVEANPIGLLKMEDEKGPDDLVVCVPCHDPGWNVFTDISQLPGQLCDEIDHFFTVCGAATPRPGAVAKPRSIRGSLQ